MTPRLDVDLDHDGILDLFVRGSEWELILREGGSVRSLGTDLEIEQPGRLRRTFTFNESRLELRLGIEPTSEQISINPGRIVGADGAADALAPRGNAARSDSPLSGGTNLPPGDSVPRCKLSQGSGGDTQLLATALLVLVPDLVIIEAADEGLRPLEFVGALLGRNQAARLLVASANRVRTAREAYLGSLCGMSAWLLDAAADDALAPSASDTQSMNERRPRLGRERNDLLLARPRDQIHSGSAPDAEVAPMSNRMSDETGAGPRPSYLREPYAVHMWRVAFSASVDVSAETSTWVDGDFAYLNVHASGNIAGSWGVALLSEEWGVPVRIGDSAVPFLELSNERFEVSTNIGSCDTQPVTNHQLFAQQGNQPEFAIVPLSDCGGPSVACDKVGLRMGAAIGGQDSPLNMGVYCSIGSLEASGSSSWVDNLELVQIFSNPTAKCAFDGSGSWPFPLDVAAMVNKADFATGMPFVVEVAEFSPTQHCDGSEHYVEFSEEFAGGAHKVMAQTLRVSSLRLEFSPVRMAVPVDIDVARADIAAGRQTEGEALSDSQFDFDDADEGQLIIEHQAPAPDLSEATKEIRSLIARASCWRPPVIGESHDRRDDKFTRLSSPDDACTGIDFAFRSLNHRASYLGLPGDNSDFGRKTTELWIQDFDYPSTWPLGLSIFNFPPGALGEHFLAHSVDIEVFFDPFASNHPPFPRDYPIDDDEIGVPRKELVPRWVAENHNLHAVPFAPPTAPDQRTPNAVNYWSQEVSIEDGSMTLADHGALRWGGAVGTYVIPLPEGDLIIEGYTPKLIWKEYRGVAERVIMYWPNRNEVDITDFARVSVHERVHVYQFLCSSECGSAIPGYVSATSRAVSPATDPSSWCWARDVSAPRGGWAVLSDGVDNFAEEFARIMSHPDSDAIRRGLLPGPMPHCSDISPSTEPGRFLNWFSYPRELPVDESPSIFHPLAIYTNQDDDVLCDLTARDHRGTPRNACVRRGSVYCSFPAFPHSTGSGAWSMCDTDFVGTPLEQRNPHFWPEEISRSISPHAYHEVDWAVGGAQWQK